MNIVYEHETGNRSYNRKGTDHTEERFQNNNMQKEMIVRQMRDRGCRITKARLTLLDVILGQDCSSCKEIYYIASQMIPGIGIATVYRMMNLLEEIGAINRSNSYKISYCEHCSGNGMDMDYHDIIECIASALDAKDSYTAGHSQRVSDMAHDICQLIGLSKEDTERIHIAAHLHDIGKIGIPDSVLKKPEKLNDEEWEQMKQHPQIGANILSKSHRLVELKEIVLHHHERYDGKGYPSGLKAEEIPVGARIIAICDSIDAMTSTRHYRNAMTLSQCYVEIERNLGKMYDPIIGRYVLEHWEEITRHIAEQ